MQDIISKIFVDGFLADELKLAEKYIHERDNPFDKEK